MMARYGEDDLVTRAHGRTRLLSCVPAFVEFSHVFWSVRDIGMTVCLCMCAHTHIHSGKGQKALRFSTSRLTRVWGQTA